jgi:thiol:disulfide interchange protein DsbD
MEKFKIAMGFPMLATAIWLFSFTAKRFGTDGPLWVGLFLVTVALAAWIWGEFVQRGRRWRGLAAVISLLLLAAGYGYGLEKQLHWRSPVKSTSSSEIQTDAAGIAWQKWSAAAVEQARAEGRPVLVDFTADWCLTCLYNKRTSIEVPAVLAKLKEINAATFIGDNTDNDPAIVAELKRFGRAGVPLVLVYPSDPGRPPIVLPALLTKGIVLDALNKVARPASKSPVL